MQDREITRTSEYLTNISETQRQCTRGKMRFAAPAVEGGSECSDDLEDFLDSVTTREASLRRQARAWVAARDAEAAQTDQIISQLSSELHKNREALLDAEATIRELKRERTFAQQEISTLRGKLRFMEARANGLTADLKARRTLAAASEARLHEEIVQLRRDLRILRSLRTSS